MIILSTLCVQRLPVKLVTFSNIYIKVVSVKMCKRVHKVCMKKKIKPIKLNCIVCEKIEKCYIQCVRRYARIHDFLEKPRHCF